MTQAATSRNNASRCMFSSCLFGIVWVVSLASHCFVADGLHRKLNYNYFHLLEIFSLSHRYVFTQQAPRHHEYSWCLSKPSSPFSKQTKQLGYWTRLWSGSYISGWRWRFSFVSVRHIAAVFCSAQQVSAHLQIRFEMSDCLWLFTTNVSLL